MRNIDHLIVGEGEHEQGREQKDGPQPVEYVEEIAGLLAECTRNIRRTHTPPDRCPA